MSYTIVIDETERSRQIENRINAAVRRCRIGKVRGKIGIKWADQGLPGFDRVQPQPVIQGQFYNQTSWWQAPLH